MGRELMPSLTGDGRGEPVKSKSVSRATYMRGNSVTYLLGGTCVYVEMAEKGGRKYRLESGF